MRERVIKAVLAGELKFAEIASELGISVDALHQHLSRAVKRGVIKRVSPGVYVEAKP